MIMMLIAASLGISVLVVAKVLLGWLLPFSLYKISRLWRYCCRRRDHYQAEADRNKLGMRGNYSL